MIEKEKTLCFTGHRNLPKEMASLMALKQRLIREIHIALEQGIDTFLFGGAYGFDLLCGASVLSITQMDCSLICILPFVGHDVKWNIKDKEEFIRIQRACTKTIITSGEYSKDVYRKRNQFLVDNSSKVIAYWDGKYSSGTAQTLRMARKKELEIINIYE